MVSSIRGTHESCHDPSAARPALAEASEDRKLASPVGMTQGKKAGWALHTLIGYTILALNQAVWKVTSGDVTQPIVARQRFQVKNRTLCQDRKECGTQGSTRAGTVCQPPGNEKS
jgi:hypothetical protein